MIWVTLLPNTKIHLMKMSTRIPSFWKKVFTRIHFPLNFSISTSKTRYSSFLVLECCDFKNMFLRKIPLPFSLKQEIMKILNSQKFEPLSLFDLGNLRKVFLKTMHSNEKDVLSFSFEVEIFTKSLGRRGVS